MTPPGSSAVSSEPLDLRVIAQVSLGQFVPWLIVVLLVAWSGYPGVVCITPVAWLIALRVGLLCASRSASARPARRVQEAALAGACLGLLQGLLFWVVVPLLGPLQAGEQGSATALILVMLAAGILIGAGLSGLSAYLIEQRRRPAEGPPI